MTRSILWMTVPLMLVGGLVSEARAQDQERYAAPSAKEAVPSAVPYCYKTKEQVAFELFLSALRNVQELRTVGTYESYLQTYVRSLDAVYGEHASVIRVPAAPAIVEKWRTLSPDRREAISKQVSELIAQSP